MNLLNQPVTLLMLEPSQIDEEERARKDYGNLAELTESIKERGLIHPIAVAAPIPGVENGRFKLLAGGRRLKACQAAKLTQIPARVYPHSISQLERKSIELAENIHREDLTYPEEVALCKEIHELQIAIHGEKVSTAKDAPGWSQADTARLLGKSPALITSELQLAKAIETLPQLAALKNKSEALKVLSMMQEDAVKGELARRLSESKAETGDAKLKKKLCDSFIIKDFFVGSKELPDNIFNLIEIDPPYGIDLNNLKKHESAGEAQMEGYNEIDSEQYPIFLSRTLKEAWRLLKSDGWLIFWFAPDPWILVVYQAIRRAGFNCNMLPAIWVKVGGPGQSMHPELYLSSNYEPFFYARKHTSTIAQMGMSNTFLHHRVPPNAKKHPTERPIELMEDILKTFVAPGSKVLVPFLGGGNTLMAAANLDMEAIGFELSQKYKDSFIIEVYSEPFGTYYSRRKE